MFQICVYYVPYYIPPNLTVVTVLCPVLPSVMGNLHTLPGSRRFFVLSYLILNIMQEVLLCSFLLLLEDFHHQQQQK